MDTIVKKQKEITFTRKGSLNRIRTFFLKDGYITVLFNRTTLQIDVDIIDNTVNILGKKFNMDYLKKTLRYYEV